MATHCFFEILIKPVGLKDRDQQRRAEEMGERGLTQPPTKLEKREEKEWGEHGIRKRLTFRTRFPRWISVECPILKPRSPCWTLKTQIRIWVWHFVTVRNSGYEKAPSDLIACQGFVELARLFYIWIKLNQQLHWDHIEGTLQWATWVKSGLCLIYSLAMLKCCS